MPRRVRRKNASRLLDSSSSESDTHEVPSSSPIKSGGCAAEPATAKDRHRKTAVVEQSTSTSSRSSSSSSGSSRSSSSSGSSSKESSSSSEEDTELDDETIARIEEEAERQRKKDKVRRRYILEDADEGGDDEDEDEEEEEDEEAGNNKFVCSDNDDEGESSSSSSSGGDDDSGSDGGAGDSGEAKTIGESGHDKQKKKKNKRPKEDLSFESQFANRRAVDEELDGWGSDHTNDFDSTSSRSDDDDDPADLDLPGEGVNSQPASDVVGISDNDEINSDEQQLHGGADGRHTNDSDDKNSGYMSDSRNPGGGDDENDGNDGDDRVTTPPPQVQGGMSEADLVRAQLHDDPDCCNNLSRCLRVVKEHDVQIDPNVDGYAYCFTSPADGPVLSRMALQQVLVLLHIVYSFIPEKCVVETEYLKPTFDRSGGANVEAGLEKLQKKVPMTEDETRDFEETRQRLSQLPISEMPFDMPYVAEMGGGDAASAAANEEGVINPLTGGYDYDSDCGGGSSQDPILSAHDRVRRSMMAGQKCQLQIVDVADILVIPVCITHIIRGDDSSGGGGGGCSSRKKRRGTAKNGGSTTHGARSVTLDDDLDAWGVLGEEDEYNDDDDDGSNSVNKEKTSGFWMVVLKTRRCYNFSGHLHWLVSNVDREDRTNLKNMAKREYEEIMSMIREVILYQYEQSPNTVAFFRALGAGTRIDPLQRLTEVCTPDSLDHVCSIFEAYRSMEFHVKKEDSRREILHVTGFSETMLYTGGMLEKSLAAQKKWHTAFAREKERIAKNRQEMAKAQAMRNAEEREARLFELERKRANEAVVHLPTPVLYPIKSKGQGVVGDRRRRRQEKNAGESILYDEYAEDDNHNMDDNDNGDDDDDECMKTGIPDFPLIMRVDVQGKFGKEKTLLAFQAKFGSLPAAAMQQVTEMMYNTSGENRYCHRNGRKKSREVADEDSVRRLQLSRDIFLPDPKIIQPYTRMKMFKPDEFTMEGFKKAGCDSHLLERIMNVVRNTPDHTHKLQLFNDYLRRIMRQHISSVLNNDLRSNHALYTAKYLEQGKFTSCRDLRGLIDAVAPRFRDYMTLDKAASREQRRPVYVVRSEAYALDSLSPAYWHLNSSNTFVCYSWLMDDLLRYHNENFFYLGAQNLRICNDVWVGMILFRLGQHEDWSYMGGPTIISDAGCKLRRAATGFGSNHVDSEGVIISEKRPSTGLDLNKDALNKRRTSVRKYVKGSQQLRGSDAQELTQLRRATAGGYHLGYVLFVNGEVEKVPDNELGMDCVLPEGPPDNFEGMCSLFNNIPRDQDHDSEQWTTVDKEKNGIRAKGVLKVLQGFQLYLGLMGKNFTLEKKAETRYLDLAIVCNVQESNGPVDKEGLKYMISSSSQAQQSQNLQTTRRAMQHAEDRMDSRLFRKGIVRSDDNPKCRNKGPRPGDKDQKLWAPLHYFVHSTAGTIVAMMHKLGMISLQISYDVDMVSRFLYDHLTSTLGCLMDANDETYSGRYYDSIKCRMVAETVLRTTFMSMATCENQDEAVVHAINTLKYNALHLSLLPVMQERFIKRVLQYEPLLGIAVLGMTMKVPVVSMQSIMQLMNGRQVTNETDLLAMRTFVQDALRNNDMVQYLGMDGYGGSDPTSSSTQADDEAAAGGGAGVLPGYVTCKFLKKAGTLLQQQMHGHAGAAQARSSAGGGGSAAAGPSASSISMHGIPMDPINQMIRVLYKNNEKTLQSCGFLRDFFGFQRCVHSLMRAYDLRRFFGGMEAYHNGQRMAEILGVDTQFRFASNFVDGRNGQADPIMLPARIPQYHRQSPAVPYSSSHYAEASFCISLRIWDVLLWFAIMQRPRRDVGICTDFANTLADYAIQLLPRSVFPYDAVTMTRIDAVDKTHVFAETQFHADRHGGRIFRPSVIPRHINTGIDTSNFKLQCAGRVAAGVVEDEMYFANIIFTAEHMGIPWHQFPLDQCPTLTVHWEYGACCPLRRYFQPADAGGMRRDDENDDAIYNCNDEDSRDSSAGEPCLRQQRKAEGRMLSLPPQLLEDLRQYSEAVVYFNPRRHSMMLYVVDPRLSDHLQYDDDSKQMGCAQFAMDGGPGWEPCIRLVHEFTLLPALDPLGPRGMLGEPPMRHGVRVDRGCMKRGYEEWGVTMGSAREEEEDTSSGWGAVTTRCTSVQDMQNQMFRLGFGPMPYFRRAGVLVHMSPEEADDDDQSKFRFGCIVPHRRGVHGCCCREPRRRRDEGNDDDSGMEQADDDDSAGDGSDDDDEDPCYFCHNNPFFEVLFNNPASVYCCSDSSSARGSGSWKTVPVTASRAAFRTVPVGTRMLITIGTLRKVMPLFEVAHQTHILKEVQTRVLERRAEGEVMRRKQQHKKMRKGACSTGMNHLSADVQAEIHRQVDAWTVRCFLNVTSVMQCQDGYVCIAMSCACAGARNAGKDVQNLYVAPQHLALPEDERTWEKSAAFVFI